MELPLSALTLKTLQGETRRSSEKTGQPTLIDKESSAGSHLPPAINVAARNGSALLPARALDLIVPPKANANMSSRQMRKLRMQQEALQNIQKSEEETSDVEEEAVFAPPKPRVNAFAGFAALAGEDEEEENEEDATETPAAGTLSEEAVNEDATPAKKSKKSKKKKAKKAKKSDAPETAPEAADEADEIDRAIEELKLAQERQAESSSKWDAADSRYNGHKLSDLFQINFQHLKAINEMRKVFGKDIIDAAIAEDTAQDAAAQAQRRRQDGVDLETLLRRLPPNVKPVSDVILKRNPFIEGKKTWSNASSGGLTMKIVSERNNGAVEFSFAHEKFYDARERDFFVTVQSYEPMNIVYFLLQNPYHVSSLIQVSKIATQDQNSALSAELCEKALFAFGRVTISSFRKKLEEGRARLDFARPENRQFYLAGYNYIRNLIRKGTYRTALEWTKLLVGLNHEDPYALINWLHVLAVRAHEAQWFVDLCNSELLDDNRGLLASLYFKQTVVLAKLQLNDRVGAMAALIEGMERLPWLYAALFSRLNLDVPKSIWGLQPRDENEELYTQLYIHLAADLWNNTQAMDLLMEAARAAQKVNAQALPAAPLVSLSTARFVYLDNTPGMMGLVPRGMMDTSPNFDFDPLPPREEDNIFSSEAQRLPWTTRAPIDSPADLQAVLRRLVQQRGPPPEAHGDIGRAADGDQDEGEGLVGQDQAGLDALVEAISTGDEAAGFGGGFLNFLNRLRALGGVTAGTGTGPEDIDVSDMPGAWGDEEDEWDDDMEADDDHSWHESHPENSEEGHGD